MTDSDTIERVALTPTQVDLFAQAIAEHELAEARGMTFHNAKQEILAQALNFVRYRDDYAPDAWAYELDQGMSFIVIVVHGDGIQVFFN